MDARELQRSQDHHGCLKTHVSEILDLGEILISYGEFLENNRPLAPASYAFEWWAEELKKAGGDPAGPGDDHGEEAIAISRSSACPFIPATPISGTTFPWRISRIWPR